MTIGNAFSSNYIEYKNNGEKDKLSLIKEYLNMTRPYLSGAMNYIKLKENEKFI